MNIEVLPLSAPPPRRQRDASDARDPYPVSFQREPAPLVPRGNSWMRWITAKAVGLHQRKSAAAVAAEHWPSDRVVRDVIKAASAPAMYNVPGWAAELIHTVVSDMLAALGPAAAGAQLLKECTLLNGNGIIVAPGFVASAANAAFVGDGQPIPVKQFADSAVSLMPYKLGAIAVLTEEMLNSSNAEQLIGDTLVRSAAAALDVALFGLAAGTSVQPAGLRYGIAALTASTDPAGAWEQYFEDAAALINSVATVGGNGPFFLVANPGRGVQMRLRALGDEGNPYEILGSTAMGLDMMAVAPGAVVAAMDPEPEIDVGNAAQLVMSDPAADTNTGSPQKTMFQTVSVALKLRWRISWALRDPRGVAWLTPNWK